MKITVKLFSVFALIAISSLTSAQSPPKPEQREEKAGWTIVHLAGSPAEIGYQHGFLLADEIVDAISVVKFDSQQESGKDWNWFRLNAHRLFCQLTLGWKDADGWHCWMAMSGTAG